MNVNRDMAESMLFDEGIRHCVEELRNGGVETFESCEGGEGHAYPQPTVRFHGYRAEGLRALAIALEGRLPVAELRRVWPIIDGEPTGPYWELTFVREDGTKPNRALPSSRLAKHSRSARRGNQTP